MESGRERLQYDAVRNATKAEVEKIRWENLRLEQL